MSKPPENDNTQQEIEPKREQSPMASSPEGQQDLEARQLRLLARLEQIFSTPRTPEELARGRAIAERLVAEQLDHSIVSIQRKPNQE